MFERLAVIGATGAVGRIVLDLLEAREFPYGRLRLLASARSAGKTVAYRGEPIEVEELTAEALKDLDLVIASTPDDVAKEMLPLAVKAGAVVIDESGAWRMDPKVPLIIPEVNPHAVARHRGLIASPNCSTTQMVVALKPLHDAARVRRVVVSSYQAVSGAGLQGNVDLEEQTRAVQSGKQYQATAFAHPIAFNCIPQIGSVREAGYTSEEMKMVYETRKILDDDTIQVCPTCVRVPVAHCHSESILVETERPIAPEEARELFQAFPGIEVIDEPQKGRYPLPLDCAGKDEVFVGRIRRDLSHPNGLAFWCVSDNLRKGAATNAVQIAELLLKERSAISSQRSAS
jgi:aspartate-semialdehyde dehydrogenase